MPNKLTITVNPRDQKRLNNKLKSLDKFADFDLDKLINSTAKEAQNKMESNAPVDTGRLRRNLGFEHLSNGIEFYSEAIDPDTGIDYAPSQEYGTRLFKAHPYFYKNIKWFNNRFRLKISDAITKILLKR